MDCARCGDFVCPDCEKQKTTPAPAQSLPMIWVVAKGHSVLGLFTDEGAAIAACAGVRAAFYSGPFPINPPTKETGP